MQKFSMDSHGQNVHLKQSEPFIIVMLFTNMYPTTCTFIMQNDTCFNKKIIHVTEIKWLS